MAVFGAPQNFAGGFRADKVKLSLPGARGAGAGGDATGLLIQNVQFSFTQQITLLYEIGSNNVYYVGGRAQGTATIARILGPAVAQCLLLTGYGDLCDPKNITFDASAGCKAGLGCKYTLKSAVLTTIALSVNANDIVINENLQFIFLDLDVAPGGAAA